MSGPANPSDFVNNFLNLEDYGFEVQGRCDWPKEDPYLDIVEVRALDREGNYWHLRVARMVSSENRPQERNDE